MEPPIYSRASYQYKENINTDHVKYHLTSEFVQTESIYSLPSLIQRYWKPIKLKANKNKKIRNEKKIIVKDETDDCT